MYIRPLDTTSDFPALSALFAFGEPEPPTPELLHEWEGNAPAGLLRQRMVVVAETAGDKLIGYCDAVRWPWDAPGLFTVAVLVAPLYRRQGWGTRLAEAALGFARQQGAMRLAVEVRDNVPAGVRFAERYSFRTDRHIFESRLHLAAFDEQPCAGTIGRVEAEGIRFFTLADVGDTDAARRKLYDLNVALLRDIPGHDGTYMPFEQFQKTVCSASWYRPDGQIVAASGDEWVGMAAVGYFEATNSMYNMFTGVAPAWRGKHIALALKLLAIACARQYGADYISTNNDSENAPMLAVNRKLGYHPEPGFYRMLRDLAC